LTQQDYWFGCSIKAVLVHFCIMDSVLRTPARYKSTWEVWECDRDRLLLQSSWRRVQRHRCVWMCVCVCACTRALIFTSCNNYAKCTQNIRYCEQMVYATTHSPAYACVYASIHSHWQSARRAYADSYPIGGVRRGSETGQKAPAEVMDRYDEHGVHTVTCLWSDIHHCTQNDKQPSPRHLTTSRSRLARVESKLDALAHSVIQLSNSLRCGCMHI